MQAETKERILALVGFSAIGCLVSLYLGQDANFDLLNYHLHNAWALVHHRWTVDLFAAGIHSYFNPLLDLPYYLLLQFVFPDSPSMLVAMSGLPYGALVFFVYLISAQLASYLNIRSLFARWGFIASAVCLGGSGAATWSQIGTTTNEVVIGVFVLAAFNQLLKNVCSPKADDVVSFRRYIYAGALLGVAAGLKMTAAIYAPGSAIVILLMSGDFKKGIKQSFLFSTSWIAFFLIVYGFWGWHLYKMTGSPFFPLFNNIFNSDWMAPSSWKDTRFIPKNFLEWVLYPFFWLTRESTLIAEMPFRDGRFALAYISIVLWCLGALKRSISVKLVSCAKPINVMVIFIITSYVIWLFEFSILRYAVAIECLSSLFLVSFVILLVRDVIGMGGAQAILGVMFMSMVLTVWTRFPQWGRVPIGENILRIQVPPLKDGSLIIFADNPMSFLSLPLSKRGQGMHFIGLPRDLANGRTLNGDLVGYRLGRLLRTEIANNSSSLSVLFYARNVPPDANITPFGLELDLASCQIGRSSVFENFYLCKARVSKSFEQKERVFKYKFVAQEVSAIPGANMDFKWATNDCTDETSNGSADINWQTGAGGASLYVSGERLNEDAKLIVRGGGAGEVKTGKWINAGQRYFLKNTSGQQLAEVDIGYARCN